MPLPDLNHINSLSGELDNLARLSSLEGRINNPTGLHNLWGFGEFECAYGFPLPPEPGDGADGWAGE
jgi:hypothetical protein